MRHAPTPRSTTSKSKPAKSESIAAKSSDASSLSLVVPRPSQTPSPAIETLLGIMQQVSAILEQAVNTHRGSWQRLVFLGERHATAQNCIKLLRSYHTAGDAALHYLSADLSDLLEIPDLAKQMSASLQGRTRLSVALHFLHEMEIDMQLDDTTAS